VPFRIKHYPGVVLDVVLSSSGENTSAIADRNRDTASTSTEEDTENLQATPPHADTSRSDDGAFMLLRASMLPSTDAHSDFERKPRVYLSPKLITTPGRQDPIQYKMEQQRMRRTHKVDQQQNTPSHSSCQAWRIRYHSSERVLPPIRTPFSRNPSYAQVRHHRRRCGNSRFLTLAPPRCYGSNYRGSQVA